MTKAIFLFALLLRTSLFSQEHKSGFKVITIKEYTQLENRIASFRTGVYIADSMYVEYLDSAYFLQISESSSYRDGLTWVRGLYLKTQTYRPRSKYCKRIIAEIDARIQQETIDEQNRQYQKIIDTAEKRYAEGKIDVAVELYKRALMLKPDDQNSRKRLEELELELRNKQ